MDSECKINDFAIISNYEQIFLPDVDEHILIKGSIECSFINLRPNVIYERTFYS